MKSLEMTNQPPAGPSQTGAAYEMLEPCEAKVSRTVLRGG
jgi:hypothetical protein